MHVLTVKLTMSTATTETKKVTIEDSLKWCKDQPESYPKVESGAETAGILLALGLGTAAVMWLASLKKKK